MGSPSEEFGPYRVYEQIGLGGMATVHRAETKGLAGFSKQVALKRMLPGIAADERLVQSFIREARLASHLRHANVAQTYDLGKVGDTYFIAMELVPGRNLREILERCATVAGHMPLAIAMNIVNQIADALDYAHNLCDESGSPLGIIHRDVSPANVIVSEGGVVKLIDFGIAKATKGPGLQTRTGTIKGKFSYLAPESLLGPVDARADLFALGVIAHELLANRPLFQGNDDMDTLNRVREMPILAPSQINANVPAAIDSIVMTALERDPDRRWQRASALREALTMETKLLGLVARDAEVIAWIEGAFADEVPEPSEPSIVITADAPVTHHDQPVESWNDMETREVKQMAMPMQMLERRPTSAHVVPRKDRSSSPAETARGSSPRHPVGSSAFARGSSPRHDANPPATSARDSSPRHDADGRATSPRDSSPRHDANARATSPRDSSPHHDADQRATSSARDSSPRHDSIQATAVRDSSPRHDAGRRATPPVMPARDTSPGHAVPRVSSPRDSTSERDSSPRHDADRRATPPAMPARDTSPGHAAPRVLSPRDSTSTRDRSPHHDADHRATSPARDSSPRHDAIARAPSARDSSPRHDSLQTTSERDSSPRHDAIHATTARDSSPRHDAVPRPTSSARDSSPRQDAVPRPTSSARDSSPRHATSTTPTAPVRTVPAHGRALDDIPVRDSALTLQTPLARERLPTLNRPPTPDPEPRDSAPTIESSLVHERAATVADRRGGPVRTLAAADDAAARSGVPRLPLVAEPSHAAIAVHASSLRAERAIEAALDELDDVATRARIVPPADVRDAEVRGSRAENFLLPILVLIAAGGAAAVVYFALPHLT